MHHTRVLLRRTPPHKHMHHIMHHTRVLLRRTPPHKHMHHIMHHTRVLLRRTPPHKHTSDKPFFLILARNPQKIPPVLRDLCGLGNGVI
jgi:hypothetical protein